LSPASISSIAAGVITLITAYFMPARTPTGAMLKAMLMAYRQTLRWTLNQSNSMDEVVARRPLPWVETPDAAMAWGVAFAIAPVMGGEVLTRAGGVTLWVLCLAIGLAVAVGHLAAAAPRRRRRARLAALETAAPPPA
jgi:hypothetical protein